jgi:indole-3-glycerol phosphate synthase
MIQHVPDILSRIIADKRRVLENVYSRRKELEEAAVARVGERRDFRRSLVANPPSIISEIKKASPSRGVLSEDFQPVEIAQAYEAGGAAAMSVLTDENHFQGSLADLETARAAVQLPVLRKDFTIDPIHVIEAAAHGADAILLIAAVLSVAEMRSFRELAASYNMAALVEVHSDDELRSALESGAEIVGVNNRNLHTFEVTLDTSVRLAAKMPPELVKVAESGIHSAEDVSRLRQAGFQAFLVGEHLMRSGDPAGALRALRS